MKNRPFLICLVLLVLAIVATIYWGEIGNWWNPPVSVMDQPLAEAPASPSTSSVTPSQPAPAPAAPAPRVEAPAPAPVVSQEAPSKEAAVTVYTVKSGDTLGKIAPKNWKAVCEANTLKNCNKIYPGQKLVLSISSSTTSEKLAGKPTVKKSVPVAKQKAVSSGKPPKAKPAQVKKDEALVDGYAPYRKVGVNPYGPHRTPELDRKVLMSWGYTEGEVQRFHALEQSGQCELRPIPLGTKFDQMVEGKGKTVPKKLYAAWDKPVQSGRFCVLSEGDSEKAPVVIIIISECLNLAVPVLPSLPPKPLVVQEPEKTPDLIGMPAPQPEEPKDQPVIKPTPTPALSKAAELCKKIEPGLTIGEEHEFRKNGNSADSRFLSAQLYCMWYFGKDGEFGNGVRAQLSSWEGHVNNGAGHFDGHMEMFGLGHKYISYNGWDASLGLPMFGKLHERFNQGLYSSERNFTMVGLAAEYNNYQRRMDGEKWIPKWQVFGSASWAMSQDLRHSWDGREIADKSDIDNFSGIYSVGGRVYIYDNPYALPYVQGGLFIEPPNATASARIGIADPDEICGIHIGYDFDLKHSGNEVEAWGWWCDPIQGIEVARTAYRAEQVKVTAKEMGVEIDPKTKAFKIVDPVKFYGTEPKSEQ